MYSDENLELELSEIVRYGSQNGLLVVDDLALVIEMYIGDYICLEVTRFFLDK